VIAFLDTSALVKFYLDEVGSGALQERIEGETVAVSQLTYGETFATFARRLRDELVTAEEHRELCDVFTDDWETFSRIPFSDEVLAHVPGLCHRHPLRGADAMQLACATMLHEEKLEIRFFTSDRQLLTAARAEGLAVFDPESS